MLRGDYTDVIVNAHKSPDRYAEQKVTMPDGATATMICTIVDIEGEPREILFYIPENASELQPTAPCHHRLGWRQPDRHHLL